LSCGEGQGAKVARVKGKPKCDEQAAGAGGIGDRIA
jgi:hypothetical protein